MTIKLNVFALKKVFVRMHTVHSIYFVMLNKYLKLKIAWKSKAGEQDKKNLIATGLTWAISS